MYKLIAIDMDGTLLDSYGNVSNENKLAIKKALDKDIQVVLTSGRMPRAMLGIANEIKANKYIISGNGAAIFDIENDTTIYNNYIKKEKLLEIIKICEENSIFYNIYTNNFIITKSFNYNILFFHNENKKNLEDKKIKINVMENIYSYVKNYEDDDFLKIIICDGDELIFKSIMNKLRTIKQVDILEVSHMSKKIIQHGSQEKEIAYFYTEITNENVNKWTAIEELIKMLNIKPEEVIAIGDNINDEQMIKNAKVGVAMGNSNPYIKKIADEVTKDNNLSGVAEVIDKYIQ